MHVCLHRQVTREEVDSFGWKRKKTERNWCLKFFLIIWKKWHYLISHFHVDKCECFPVWSRSSLWQDVAQCLQPHPTGSLPPHATSKKRKGQAENEKLLGKQIFPVQVKFDKSEVLFVRKVKGHIILAGWTKTSVYDVTIAIHHVSSITDNKSSDIYPLCILMVAPLSFTLNLLEKLKQNFSNTNLIKRIFFFFWC